MCRSTSVSLSSDESESYSPICWINYFIQFFGISVRLSRNVILVSCFYSSQFHLLLNRKLKSWFIFQHQHLCHQDSRISVLVPPLSITCLVESCPGPVFDIYLMRSRSPWALVICFVGWWCCGEGYFGKRKMKPSVIINCVHSLAIYSQTVLVTGGTVKEVVVVNWNESDQEEV